MALFSGELLRISASGRISTSFLTIEDSNAFLASQDSTAIYTLGGVRLETSPTVDFGDIQGKAADGSLLSSSMTHFTSGGADYYLLAADTAPDQFAKVTGTSSAGIVGGFAYLNQGMALDHGPLLHTNALVVTFDASNDATALMLDQVSVNDDDSLIQFNGQNGLPNSETNAPAQIVLGQGELVADFNTGNAGSGDTQMARVFVTCETTTGTKIFEALRVTQPIFDGTMVYYLPRTGSIDLTTVTAYVSERAVQGTANGMDYGKFSLTTDPLHSQTAASLGTYLHGSMVSDGLIGQAGNDTLVGGMGSDAITGSGGNDSLSGGAQADQIIGGKGFDHIYGGSDDDTLAGNDQSDTVTGGYGADSLSGGDGSDAVLGQADGDILLGDGGNDHLDGGAGHDRLYGGDGADSLTGGAGSDVFVFKADAYKDHAIDYKDGTDHLRLFVDFAAMIITTLGTGRVQIDYAGDSVILADLAGTLTAADLTASDFI